MCLCGGMRMEVYLRSCVELEEMTFGEVDLRGREEGPAPTMN